MLVAVILLLLVLTAFWHFPGLHLVAQGLLILAIVALPVILHDELSSLFDPTVLSTRSFLLPHFLIAIGLGLLVVTLSSGIRTKTGELPVPVALVATNLADGVSANFGTTRKVKVVITAPRSRWATLKADDFSATVDTSRQGEGTYDLQIAVTAKSPDVKINRVNPKKVVVAVEPIIKKTLPVALKVSGRAGNDLVADTPIINPEKVEVAGPKSVVSDLTEAVVTFNLNGETKRVEQSATVVALDSQGDKIANLTFSPDRVTFAVDLVKAGKLKTVAIRPNFTGQVAAGYWVKEVSLSPSVVVVTGSLDTLEKLSQLMTESISLAGLSQTSEIKSKLSLPAGVTASDNLTDVTVAITLEKTQTTKTISPEIVYLHLSSGLKVATITPAAFTATVAGNAETLSALAESSVKISVELASYQSAGRYSVAVSTSSFTLPGGVTLVSFLPSAIDVTLEER